MTGQVVARTTDLSDLPNPDSRVIQFLDAWKAARGSSLVPYKRDLDPLSFPRLLPCVWLYRHDAESNDFTCKLAGESINRSWGYSIAGQSATQILGADHAVVTGIWRTILDTPLIHYGRSERLDGNRMYKAERIVLPMIGDDAPDDRPDHILGLSLYQVGTGEEPRPELLLENAFQIHCVDIR